MLNKLRHPQGDVHDRQLGVNECRLDIRSLVIYHQWPVWNTETGGGRPRAVGEFAVLPSPKRL